MQDPVSVGLIAVGTVSMALNLFFFRSLFSALPFVDPTTRSELRFRQVIYGLLIVVFLVAYAITAIAFYQGWDVIRGKFVAVIFLCGALFVGLGIRIQLRMVEALLRTMERLVPICAECRRVRIPEAGREDGGSWQTVNLWFKNDEVMTHSICPECAARHAAGQPAPHPAR